MNRTLIALGLIAGSITAASAHAEVGSTGVGAHATVPLTSRLNARFGTSYLGYAHSYSTTGLTGLDYDLKLKTNTYDALLDWYPMHNSAFRLTGGLAKKHGAVGECPQVQGVSCASRRDKLQVLIFKPTTPSLRYAA